MAQKLNEIHGGRYIARGTMEYESLDTIVFDEFIVNPLFDDYYRRMIQLCIENEIQVRIVKLPLPDNEVFTDQYRNKLRERFPAITIDWFSSYEKDRFADTGHMNSHGALQFSNELRELYPSDFDDAYLSIDQVTAINDSILNENKIEWILKWISGKDYSVVIKGTEKYFWTYIRERLEQNECKLYRYETDREDQEEEIYYISGTNNKKSRFSIQSSDCGGMLKVGDTEEQLWTENGEDILNIAVVDHYNQKILCVKSFRYLKNNFKII